MQLSLSFGLFSKKKKGPNFEGMAWIIGGVIINWFYIYHDFVAPHSSTDLFLFNLFYSIIVTSFDIGIIIISKIPNYVMLHGTKIIIYEW